MKKFKFSFIDFDDTIFDTGRFVAAMRELFEQAGVTLNDFNHTKKEAVAGGSGIFYDYSFERHINILSRLGYQLPGNFLEKLNQLLENNTFEMPEAQTFLQWVREVSDRVILVTAGNHDFQHKKLASTKLTSYFNEVVVVHENKDIVVANYATDNNGSMLFVNDNPKENAAIARQFPQVMVVGLINLRKFADQDQSGVPFFAKLSEIQNYVQQQA